MPRIGLVSVCLLCALALTRLAADAHQPYLVKASPGPVRIENPEISRAYYGKLESAAQSFAAESEKPFTLYVNLLVPKITGIGKQVRVRISNSKQQTVAELDGAKAEWKEFHEPFSGTDYYRGPEFRAQVPAGTYTIQVSSPDKRGKYVLAVGEKEVFSLGDMLRSMQVVSQLKAEFFAGSPR